MNDLKISINEGWPTKNKAMDEDKQQNIVAFVCGFCPSGIFSLFGGVVNDMGHFALRVLATMILGAAGGLAGLVMKDLYNRWKNGKKKLK